MPLERSHLPLLLASTFVVLAACAPAKPAMIAPAPVPEELVYETEEELGEGPIVEEEVRPVGRDLLGSVPYDLPLEANSWVEAELDYLVGQRANVIARWLERGDFFEPYIKNILLEYGLPTDLYHLAMIESGFVTTARSRAGAMGLWQFMPATARLEGLRVDATVDERLDPVRSTRAAAQHLTRLHRQFGGDWALAAAAYNAGVGRITRGLQGYGATNFWDLAIWGDLADETKHYVPRLYAMTIIARDRERFGFRRAETFRSFDFDSVKVDLATPLQELAAMSGVAGDELARLNPHLLQRATPTGVYWVWVPAGSGPHVQQAFLSSEFRKNGGHGTYVVRRGDSLNKIAATSGVPARRIRELNPKTNWDRLQIGHRLRMPAAAARALNERAPSSEAPKVASGAKATAPQSGSTPAQQRGGSGPTTAAKAKGVEHTVKSGETLWGIARKHGVQVSEIQKANKLSGTKIVVGRKLVIPGSNSAVAAREVAPAASGAASGTQHIVRQGETLWSIAREYSSTVTAIQQANRIEANVIVPGQKLLIPQ